MQLQSRHGAARSIKGVGPAAAGVRGMLSRMRSELAADAPPLPPPGQGIDTIFLLDREVRTWFRHLAGLVWYSDANCFHVCIVRSDCPLPGVL